MLGVNVAEGQSACLVTGDGRAVATSELHQGGRGAAGELPTRAIDACLDGLGVARDELDLVVLCGGAPAPARGWTGGARVHTIDDDLAMACSAFYPSGFDDAAVLVVGRGAAGSPAGAPAVRATGYRASGGRPCRVFAQDDLDGRAGSPTAALGELLGAALQGVDLHSLLDLAARGGRRAGLPCEAMARADAAFPSLCARRGVRHGVPAGASADEAWAVRELLERLAVELAKDLVRRTGARKLCVAGDAAVHGLARLDPREHRWLDQVYAPPVPDAVGAAVGAALFGWCELVGAPPPCELECAFRGRPYLEPEVAAAISAHGADDRARRARAPAVLDEVAALLAAGAVVAWFDGGAELGAPLDRRCVLASASHVAIAPRIGAGLDRAAFHAPTAAVLAEDADDYFALTGPSPFAHRVARIQPARAREVPLVVRADGTCRVHTIDAWRAPRLHDLLGRYRRLTGRPVLASAPLRQLDGRAVDSPRDALRVCERAALDAIYLDGRLVVWRAEPAGVHDES